MISFAMYTAGFTLLGSPGKAPRSLASLLLLLLLHALDVEYHPPEHALLVKSSLKVLKTTETWVQVALLASFSLFETLFERLFVAQSLSMLLLIMA